MSIATAMRSQITPPRLYGVVEAAQERLAAKLDVNGDGGLDQTELSALGGLGSGKNGPAAFAALDSDGDGKLGMRELRSSRLFDRTTLDGLLGQQSGLAGWLVADADAGGDGLLSIEEFRAIPPARPSDDPFAQILFKPEEAFLAADADQDGQLTAAELSNVMKGSLSRLPSGNPVAVAADLLARDEDASGGLSKSELGKATPSGRVDLDALFDVVDGDRDGEITEAEFQAQIAAQPGYYSSGFVLRPAREALFPLPGSPIGRSTPQEAVVRAVTFEPLAGHTAMFLLFRENLARLTDQMLDGVGRPANLKA